MQLIELHILQSFPVSCLNRDDVGAPKTATFGGVPRARISSQCLKRAIREYAQDNLPDARFNGKRTKRLAELIQKELMDGRHIKPDRALEMACAVAGAFNKKEGSPLDPKDPETETLFFASPAQTKQLAGLAMDEWGESKKINPNKDAFRSKCRKVGLFDAADIALFGRMVAADPTLTLEGAGMFGHALSTHRADNDLDFFSAVDECKKKTEDAGAGMIDTLWFTSAVYYRYAAVNLDLLFDEDHLAKLTTEERRKVLDAFIRATLLATPGARKNSMNAHTDIGYALGLYHPKGQPIQLINAYEEPVWARGGSGLIRPSVRKGLLHLKKIEDFVGESAKEKIATGTYRPETDTGENGEFTKQHIPEHFNLNDFVKRLTAHVQ